MDVPDLPHQDKVLCHILVVKMIWKIDSLMYTPVCDEIMMILAMYHGDVS